MTKTFFTKVKPKAVEGIRRVYESEGAQVYAKMGSDGRATVVAIQPDRQSKKRREPVTA